MKRRGSISMLYEIIHSLILIGLFAVTIFTYISVNADGSYFFSQFYAIDLATNAQVVNAGYGDVLLRYDNFKQTLDLNFWFSNGNIAIAKQIVQTVISKEGTTTTSSNSIPDGSTVQLEYRDGWAPLHILDDPTTVKRYYGKAQQYTATDSITSPRYLALRKVAKRFAITDADETLAACPTIRTPLLPLEDLQVALTLDGSLTAAEQERIKKAFIAVVGKKVADEGNVHITLTKNTGTTTTITLRQTSEHGVRVACLFKQHLTSLSGVPFSQDLPTPFGNEFTIDMTVVVSRDDVITNDQLGQALGLALATYYE